MNPDLLKRFSKKTSILEGSITLYLTPYITTKSQLVFDEVRNELGIAVETMTTTQQVFTLLEAHMVAVEVDEPNTPYADGLLVWWGSREETVIDRLALFEQCVSITLIAELMESYLNTRLQLPKADPILAEGEPQPQEGETEEDFLSVEGVG